MGKPCGLFGSKEIPARPFSIPLEISTQVPADTEAGNHAARRSAMASEVNVLALVKGAERYVYLYDDDSNTQLIDAFRDQAANPHLSLSWFDAMVLTKKAQEQEAAAPHEPEIAPHSRI
jgi:hypothetical protein